MAEALAKKKRIRAGHKASATKTIRQIEDILASEAPDKERLSLLRLTLNEKLETNKALDSEVIELIEDDDTLAGEIEQADDYKESVFNALIKIDRITKPTPTRPLLELRPSIFEPRPPTRVRAAYNFPSYNCAPSAATSRSGLVFGNPLNLLSIVMVNCLM